MRLHPISMKVGLFPVITDDATGTLHFNQASKDAASLTAGPSATESLNSLIEKLNFQGQNY